MPISTSGKALPEQLPIIGVDIFQYFWDGVTPAAYERHDTGITVPDGMWKVEWHAQRRYDGEASCRVSFDGSYAARQEGYTEGQMIGFTFFVEGSGLFEFSSDIASSFMRPTLMITRVGTRS